MELEKLLKDNYGCNLNEECKKTVIDFIESHESVADQDIFLIKRLTKIANQILETEPSLLEGKLERLLKFHDEGILKIERDSQKNDVKLRMQCHLYSHKGDIAYRLAINSHNNLQKIKWMSQYYASALKSAECGENVDETHAAHSYCNAAKAAKILSIRTSVQAQKIYWAKKSYCTNIKSTQYFMLFNPDIAAVNFRYAGLSAAIVYNFTHDPSMKKESLRCLNYFVTYFEQNKEKSVPELVEKTKNQIRWLEQDRLILRG